MTWSGFVPGVCHMMMGRAGAKDIDCQARRRALMIQRETIWIAHGSFRACASTVLEIIAGEDVSVVPIELRKTLLQCENGTAEVCQQLCRSFTISLSPQNNEGTVRNLRAVLLVCEFIRIQTHHVLSPKSAYIACIVSIVLGRGWMGSERQWDRKLLLYRGSRT